MRVYLCVCVSGRVRAFKQVGESLSTLQSKEREYHPFLSVPVLIGSLHVDVCVVAHISSL